MRKKIILKATPVRDNKKISLTKMENLKKYSFAKLEDLKNYASSLEAIDASFATAYDEFYSEWSNLTTLADRLEKNLYNVQTQSEDAKEYINEILNFTDSLVSDLNDFGIDPNTIPEFKNIVDTMANLEDNIFQA
jgi:hypothetical protein